MNPSIKKLEKLYTTIIEQFTNEYSKYYDCKLWHAKGKEDVVFKDMQYFKYRYLMLQEILEASISKKFVKDLIAKCENEVNLKH